MKVLNLRCDLHHSFEGWFGSEQDFQDQLARGLVECPMCGSVAIEKMLSAPRLNLGFKREEPQARRDHPESISPAPALVPGRVDAVLPMAHAPGEPAQASWEAEYLKLARRVMAATEDVGPHFAAEARRIHEGEAPERAIRGQASWQDAQELLEDGIGVLPLPLPKALKEPLQ